jgi:hypothetical protein
MQARLALRIGSALALSLPCAIAFLAIACGGPSTPPITPLPTTPADAGNEAAASWTTLTPPPSGLPPMAQMPPPGVIGSKKAHVNEKADGASCVDVVRAKGAPAADLKKFTDACAAPMKMHAVSTLLQGTAADTDGAKDVKFHAEAGHCYRAFAGFEAKSVVLGVHDSQGGVVAESATGAVPEHGALCFDGADDAVLVVSVGTGKGAFAAQVWGN